MIKLTKIASVVLGAVVAMGAAGVANASALLQIVGATANNQEVIGDPGGTAYPYAGGPGPGAGVPSSAWTPPPGPGFAPDPSFGNVLGTSGYHSSYLNLTESANVTFQFMGGGNSSLQNHFWLNPGTGYIDLFQDSHGGVTNPCPVLPGATAPTCDKLVGGPLGQNQYTFFLSAGLIAFQFITGAPNNVILDNLGVGNGNPDPHDLTKNLPGYFLGVDPYLATGQFDTSGRVVYAGLSDLPASGDHDFQDMGVRVSVPEPGSIFLIGIGMVGLAFGRRKLDIASSPVQTKIKLSKFWSAMPAFSPA